MRQVVLDIPEEVWERAASEARRIDRPVEELLANRLAGGFTTMQAGAAVEGAQALAELDFSGLTDEQLEIHMLARLPPDQADRLSDLQVRNNEGELGPDEVQEFDQLLKIAHTLTVLKGHALLAWKRRHGGLPAGYERLA